MRRSHLHRDAWQILELLRLLGLIQQVVPTPANKYVITRPIISGKLKDLDDIFIVRR